MNASKQNSKNKILQLSILKLMLVVTVVAIGFGCFVNQREIEFINSKLPALREVAREFVIDDPSQSRAVKQFQQRYGQKLWKISLPVQHDFELCVAVNEIDSTGFPKPVHSIPISSGVHKVSFWFSDIELEDDFCVAIDDTIELKIPVPWDSKRNDALPWIDGVDFTYDLNQTKKPSQELELLRFRCNQGRRAATQIGNGFLIWIQMLK